MNFFAKKPDPKEAAKAAKKETKRNIKSNQRELDREIRTLERQEQQILLDIKKRAKVAKNSNDVALKALAKQLVQLRGSRDKLITQRAQLGSISMNVTAMSAQVTAASAMESVTTAMTAVNKTVDIKTVNKNMAQFMKETETIQFKEELLDDALTDAFDSEGIADEADEVTDQVLAELGLELDKQFGTLQTMNQTPLTIPEKEKKAEEEDVWDQLPDLRDRLNAL